MIQKIVSHYLVKYLGEYIENIDSSSLNVAIFSGDIKLSSLKVKRTAFDSFQLPFSITKGYVGNLKAEIPWTTGGLSLGLNSPVKLELSDVYLVVKSKKSCEWNQKEEDERTDQLTAQKLSYGMFENPDKSADENKKKNETSEKADSSEKQDNKQENSSMFSRLTERILYNLWVQIKNVHVRFLHSFCSKTPKFPKYSQKTHFFSDMRTFLTQNCQLFLVLVLNL